MAIKRKRELAPHKAPAPALEQRHQMIAEAAYYLAEKRNFRGGVLEREADWREAERQLGLREEDRVAH